MSIYGLQREHHDLEEEIAALIGSDKSLKSEALWSSITDFLERLGLEYERVIPLDDHRWILRITRRWEDFLNTEFGTIIYARLDRPPERSDLSVDENHRETTSKDSSSSESSSSCGRWFQGLFGQS